MWTILRDDLIGVRDKLIPRRRLTRRLFPLWIKFQIKRGTKKKNKAWSNFNKCPSPQNKANIGSCEIQSTRILGMLKWNTSVKKSSENKE